MKSLNYLLEQATKKENCKIAVAAAHDKEVLVAVNDAYIKGISTAILVGDEEKIKEIAKSINMDLTPHEIVNELDGVESSKIAVKFVKENKANALMKGLIDTSIIMKAALDKENGLRTDSVMSHLAVFEMDSYHKPLFLTDAAINIAPDYNTKKQILNNSLEALKNLNINNPKVAVICAKEKVNPKMQSTVDADLLTKENFDAIVEGPIAFDGAINSEAAKVKGMDSKVSGDVDLLVMDNIEAGNALYKTLIYLANAKSGGIVLGTQKPIVLTSRSDSAYSKLVSIALGVLA